MNIIKLSNIHTDSVKHLFENPKYMGTENFDDRQYNLFCDNYLTDLENFHAFGAIKENKVVALISFYESIEEPSWYFTVYRSNNHSYLLKNILDSVINFNEKNGRLKFYTLVNKKHSNLLRRFTWSKYNNNRYGYFDEYLVPDKCKTFYFNHWELLYKRMLIPVETVVRCNFLKQEYRTILPIGGSI